MDPNECLKNLRKAMDALGESIAEGGVDVDDVESLMDRVHALDTWLSKGGFLPDDWAKGRPKT